MCVMDKEWTNEIPCRVVRVMLSFQIRVMSIMPGNFSWLSSILCAHPSLVTFGSSDNSGRRKIPPSDDGHEKCSNVLAFIVMRKKDRKGISPTVQLSVLKCRLFHPGENVWTGY